MNHPPNSEPPRELDALLELLDETTFVEGPDEGQATWGPGGILAPSDLYMLIRALSEYEARAWKLENWARYVSQKLGISPPI